MPGRAKDCLCLGIDRSWQTSMIGRCGIRRWRKPLRRVFSPNEHYHQERNHQGKDNVLLFPVSALQDRIAPRAIRCRERLGGFLALRTFLWQRVYYQELRVKNYGLQTVETCLHIDFKADFVDIFEVRGMKRKSRGVDLTPEVSRDGVTLSYRGLDESSAGHPCSSRPDLHALTLRVPGSQ